MSGLAAKKKRRCGESALTGKLAVAGAKPLAHSPLSKVLSDPGACSVLLEYLSAPCVRGVLPLVSKSFRAAASVNAYWAGAFEAHYGGSTAHRALVHDIFRSREVPMGGTQWKEAFVLVSRSVATTKQSWDEETMEERVCHKISLVGGTDEASSCKDDDANPSRRLDKLPTKVICRDCYAVVGTEILAIVKTREDKWWVDNEYDSDNDKDDGDEAKELVAIDCFSGKILRSVSIPSDCFCWGVFAADEESIVLAHVNYRGSLTVLSTKTFEKMGTLLPINKEGVNLAESRIVLNARDVVMNKAHVIATFERCTPGRVFLTGRLDTIGVMWDRSTFTCLSTFDIFSRTPDHRIALRDDGLLSILIDVEKPIFIDEANELESRAELLLVNPVSGDILQSEVFFKCNPYYDSRNMLVCGGRYALTSCIDDDKPTAYLYDTTSTAFPGNVEELDPSVEYGPANGAGDGCGNTLLVGTMCRRMVEEDSRDVIGSSDIYMCLLREEDGTMRCGTRRTLWSNDNSFRGYRDEAVAWVCMPNRCMVVAGFRSMEPFYNNQGARWLRVWDFTTPGVEKLRSAFLESVSEKGESQTK